MCLIHTQCLRRHTTPKQTTAVVAAQAHPAVGDVGAAADVLDPRAHLALALERHLQRLAAGHVDAEHVELAAAPARDHV